HWSFVANLAFKNNIVIGSSGPARVTSALSLAEIDYNGWSPDGTFVLFDSFNGLADVKARSPYEANGLILSAPVFADASAMPASYTTKVSPRDASLHPASNALDTALLLPNINDDFSGSGPDLGAWERGKPPTAYGVRAASQQPAALPNPPENVTVQ